MSAWGASAAVGLAALTGAVLAASAGPLTPPAEGAAVMTGDRNLTLSYNGRIVGLRVMKAFVQADIGERSYSAASAFRSAGIVGLFKTSTVNSSVSGERASHDFAPRAYRHVEVSGKKRRAVALAYEPGGVEVEVDPPFGDRGFPPPSETHMAEALDPLSAILAIAHPNGDPPCSRRTPVFDSKLRYDLVFSDAGREHVRTRAYRGPAYKCRAAYVPIAGFDREDLEENVEVYETPIYVWLADLGDGLLAPVRVAASFQVGPMPIGVEVEATRVEVRAAG
ncbi:MAG: DUF3108 domain-containing protein [Caulobacterales bacterium]|nr:DUF3108 domain-containing protein [Caulobacterales bacterium]